MCNEKDKPTEISIEDFDKIIERFENGEFDIKMRQCFKCQKEFLPNYDDMKCDECYFSQFPKEQVKQFMRSFFE